MMADFEAASQNAVRHGFLFNWLDALSTLTNVRWKVQEIHLADCYRDNENVCVHVKKILTLSFVPRVDNKIHLKCWWKVV